MTFIVWEASSNILLASVWLQQKTSLLDMCKTSYLQSFSVVHTLHALCKPREGWTSSFVKSVDDKGFTCNLWVHMMSRQEEDMQILSWES